MNEKELAIAIKELGYNEVMSMAVLSEYDESWCNEKIDSLKEIRSMLKILKELESRDGGNIKEKQYRDAIFTIDSIIDFLEDHRNRSRQAHDYAKHGETSGFRI